jgi:futalosine hydrolase
MHIVVCAATAFEIQPAIDFIKKELNENDIEVLITGIGLMETTYSLTKFISQRKPGLIIQAGIAGCFNNQAHLGKVVIIEKDTVADLGVTENESFVPVFRIGLTGADQFPWQKGWLVNGSELIDKVSLPKVTGITVNEISTSKEKLSYYRSIGAEIESMEGAAMHYVALKENIPFIQLRGLSNFIAERDKTKWKMEESIKTLNEEIIKLIKEIKQQ